MHTTSHSLLEQLHRPGEQEAWSRFVELYTPLIYYWARKTGLQPPDASDLVQEVFLVLAKKLPEFKYDPQQSFRGWLRAITLNKWRERSRRRVLPIDANAEINAVHANSESLEAQWDAEYHASLVGRALALMRAEFQPKTWMACWEHVVSGKSAGEVAAELGMTVDSVYAAKSRVLKRLRQELEGLLE
jgi:RNA polymerase sigma-70 factor (ECF subfamily)